MWLPTLSAQNAERMGHPLAGGLRFVASHIWRDNAAPDVGHPFLLGHLFNGTLFRALSSRKPRYGVSVSSSVFLLILAVRSSFSQLKGLPLMARIMVLNSTTEKT